MQAWHILQVLFAVGLQDWQCPWADNELIRKPAIAQGFPEINLQRHLCLVGDAKSVFMMNSLRSARQCAELECGTDENSRPTQDQLDLITHQSSQLMAEAMDLMASESRVIYGDAPKDMELAVSMVNVDHCKLVEAQLIQAVGQGMTALAGLLEIVSTFVHHPEFDLAARMGDSMDVE